MMFIPAMKNLSAVKHATVKLIADSRSRQWFLCFCLVYVSSFLLNGTRPLSLGLDNSWQAILEYAAVHNLQYGRDIVFTYGPLGYFDVGQSQGMLAGQRIIFAIIWTGIVSWSVTGLTRHMAEPFGYLFLVWFLLFHTDLEQAALLAMMYGALVLMQDMKNARFLPVIPLSVFALLSLVKFTLFMTAAATVVLCIMVQLLRRNLTSALGIAGTFCGLFLLLWRMSGQKYANLPGWIKGSQEISAGYTQAMTLVPRGDILWICMLIAALFLASVWFTLRAGRLSIRGIGHLLASMLFVFLTWKHSFVRADGRVMMFIVFMPLGFPLLFTDTLYKRMSTTARFAVASCYLGVIVLCLFAADRLEDGVALDKVMQWPLDIRNHGRQLVKIATGRKADCFAGLRWPDSMRKKPDLAVARAIIGEAPVDLWNYNQWAVLTNELNYRPRPVIQGYSAYTSYLQDLNLSFFRSPERPPFLLFKMETIDGRFPTLDDATLLPHILGTYVPVGKDGDYDILKAGPSRSPRLTLVHEQDVRFGDLLRLEAWNRTPLIMDVDVKPTLLGKALSFMYQSPVITLETFSRGKKFSNRFIPAMARRGFLLNPYILTNDDAMGAFRGVLNHPVEGICFGIPNASRQMFREHLRVRIYRVTLL